jgi:hypothetical protein
MTNSAPITFQNITPGQYDLLVAKANAAGIALTGHSGTASRLGVEVTWNYSPDSHLLTVQCLRAPFFLKPQEVNEKIEALVQETVAANPTA